MNRRDAIKAGLVMIGGIWAPKQYGATIILRGPRVPAAGAAWTDSFAEGSIDAEELHASANYAYVSQSVSLPSGTVSQLRFKVSAFVNNSAIKIACYDASNNLVESGSTTITSTGVKEISITPASITSGNHSFAICSNAGYDDFRFATLSGQTGASWLNFNNYASFPNATRPTNDSTIDEKIWFGAYIA